MNRCLLTVIGFSGLLMFSGCGCSPPANMPPASEMDRTTKDTTPSEPQEGATPAEEQVATWGLIERYNHFGKDLPILSVDEVGRWVLVRCVQLQNRREILVKIGERLFPAFEEIVDGNSTGGDLSIAAVFEVLTLMKGDRSRFRERAVVHLGDQCMPIRHAAVEFLASAGSEMEEGPLAVVLLDN